MDHKQFHKHKHKARQAAVCSRSCPASPCVKDTESPRNDESQGSPQSVPRGQEKPNQAGIQENVDLGKNQATGGFRARLGDIS